MPPSPPFSPLPKVPTTEILPGVHMPMLNFGLEVDHLPTIKLGARGLDTAFIYDGLTNGTQQREVGTSVIESGIPRDQFFITTKVPCCPLKNIGGPSTFPGGPSGPAAHCETELTNITAEFEYDLERLEMDYVDLLLIHWTCNTVEETLKQYKMMEPIFHSGKARAIGVSNFNKSVLSYLLPRVTVKPAVVQCGYSVGGHFTSATGSDDETVAYCKEQGIQYEAYSPLGNVALSSTASLLVNPTLEKIGKVYNRSTAEIAIKWVVQQGIVAVSATAKAEDTIEDFNVFDPGFMLTDAEMAELESVKIDKHDALPNSYSI